MEKELAVQSKCCQPEIKKELVTKAENKVEILMKGLHCAGCGIKIEENVRKIAGVREANLDFANSRLTLNLTNKKEQDIIIEQAIKIIKKFEPHLELEVVNDNLKVRRSEKEDFLRKSELVRVGLGSLFFIAVLIFDLYLSVEMGLFIASYLLIGGNILAKALKNITQGEIFDENFLMTLATIGAFLIGEYPEAVAVMLFYQIGETLQDIAVYRSRKSIKALMDIRPDYANLLINGDEKQVDPEEVAVGDLIIIKPGEKVPLDGKVIGGSSLIDTAALTGESIPRKVEAGDELLSGSINKTALLTLEVTKEFSNSTVNKIIELVQNASSRKSPTEKFITKFAKYYTPVVVYAAAALAVLPPLFIEGATFSQWIYRALIFLVISCPCALVVSIPLGFFGGIGAASKNGILIKGGNYLEALNYVSTVVFDKTGTLTKGIFKVTEVKPYDDFTADQVLEYAALAEIHSIHPIAKSIFKAYGKKINLELLEGYEEISGLGVKAKVKGKEIIAGNRKLMEAEKIDFTPTDQVGTVVYVAVDKKYTGSILISDELREDAKQAILNLRKLGVNKLIMLTGDNKEQGEDVAGKLGLDKVYTQLLPAGKVEKIEELLAQKGKNEKIVFVGDGINDAPVLARADIGVAMGGLGSDAAIEAADIVLMTDEPGKLVDAIKIARQTNSIVKQNIVIALGVKGLVLLMGTMGIATMWEAVFADVGVALIAVLNAMRALRVKNIV